MLTKSIEVQKYIRASAGRAGISIVFEDANEPRHDGKTIYLPRITHKTTDIELQQLMASVDHEVAHDRFSCFDVLKEKGVSVGDLHDIRVMDREEGSIVALRAKEIVQDGKRGIFDKRGFIRPVETPVSISTRPSRSAAFRG
jgi:hypothetical protein